eukprot:m.33852 g.33852  ORF g.33852 m.33852 type:complete len:200 (+) comp5073_c0_seq1:86-685(+)
MPVARVYLVKGTADDILDRVTKHSIADKVAWSLQIKAYTPRVAGGTGAGTPAVDAATVTLATFSDAPGREFGQSGETSDVFECSPQIEAVMELVGGRYRLTRTVKVSGYKVGFGDFEVKVGTVPASQRSDTHLTMAELRYHPCAYLDVAVPLLEAFADTVLPEGSSPAPIPETTQSDSEFDDRQVVPQYLTLLRSNKVL